MKTINQIREEAAIVSAGFAGACTWSEKRGLFRVVFGSGYVSEWNGMPLDATEADMAKYIEQAAYNNRVKIHEHCSHELCEECRDHIVTAIASPNFAYARERSYGTTIYHLDPASPTGVISKCGIPNHLAEVMLRAGGRTSSLSPTEDLRTAH